MAAYLKKPFSHNPLIARKPLIRVTVFRFSALTALQRMGEAPGVAEGIDDLGEPGTPEGVHWRHGHFGAGGGCPVERIVAVGHFQVHRYRSAPQLFGRFLTVSAVSGAVLGEMVPHENLRSI